MDELRETEGVEMGGGSDETWRKHERRKVWRREVEVTGGGGGMRDGRCGDGTGGGGTGARTVSDWKKENKENQSASGMWSTSPEDGRVLDKEAG